MKMKQIHEMTGQELASQLGEFNKESYNLRVQQRTGQLQKSSRMNSVKKDIARIHTELKARELAGQAS